MTRMFGLAPADMAIDRFAEPNSRTSDIGDDTPALV